MHLENTPDELFTFIGIDPSTNFAGLSIYTVNARTMNIVGLETRLINLTITNNPSPHLRLDILHKLIILDKYIEGVVRAVRPTFMILENAFINKFRMSAAAPLWQSIGTMELAAVRTDPFIRIFKYAPPAIKKAVGAHGKADKDGITVALNNIPEICNFINPNILTEHENDAAAIGYTFLKQLRENGVWLCLI